MEYAIIEISAESVKRNDSVHKLDYEVLALTSFYSGLHNHFESKEDYLSCKREILKSKTTKNVLLRIGDENYNLFSDIAHKTYGYLDNADYQLKVLANDVDGLRLSYKGVEFKTNLITAYHARNISCAIAILEAVGKMNINIFSEFSKSIIIRGRFEKFTVDNKTIIIDTGFSGAAISLIGIETMLGNNNYKIIYSNIQHDEVNDWVKNARQRMGKYLNRAKFVYLTSPDNSLEEENIFLRDVADEILINKYRYIPKIEDAYNSALAELKDDETLIIYARDHYREYRNIVQKELIKKGYGEEENE